MTSKKEDAIEKCNREERKHNDIYRDREWHYGKRNITKCNHCDYASIIIMMGVCPNCRKIKHG